MCLQVRHVTNRLECYKVPRLPRKTTWQPAWEPSKRRGFAASPIDTAKPQGNQRRETWHVGAPKRAFRARPPPICTVWNIPKGQVSQLSPWTQRSHQKTNDPRQDKWEHQNEHFAQDFLQFSRFVASQWTFSSFLAEPLNFATSTAMFRARHLSIFSTCHKMPRLPQNLHLVATWRSPANAICKKHATLKVCIQLSEGARLNYTPRTVVLSDPQSRLIIAVSQYSSRICFPASPTDTTTRQENYRDSRQDTWMQKNTHFVRYSLQCVYTFDMSRRGVAASPIDTAKPQGNQRRETWHVGAPKRAFRARPPPICAVSCRKDMFCSFPP